MAKVTPQDYVIDLGSGDGRTVITAAKRGANALGVEYNPDMVALSEFNAKQEKMTERAKFITRRHLRVRLLEGQRHHDVSSAVDQHEAASEDPRHAAGHAHRDQLVHDGGLGSGRFGNRHR